MLKKSILLLALAIFPIISFANLDICNKSHDGDIDVSIIVKDSNNNKDWLVQGWFRIPEDTCSTVSNNDLRGSSFYYYGISKNGTTWEGNHKKNEDFDCIDPINKFAISSNQDCESIKLKKVSFIKASSSGNRNFQATLVSSNESLNKTVSLENNRPEASDIEKACEILHRNLSKPTLPTTRIVLGKVINPFIYPQTRSECTGTYDTGVPDLKTCRVTSGGTSQVCIKHPYCEISWGRQVCGTRDECKDIPNSPRTTCSNIISCNTWKTEKSFNECSIAVNLKFPKFIAGPINDYINKSYKIIESGREKIKNALPIMCLSDEARSAYNIESEITQAIVDNITAEIKNRIRNRLKQEGEEWLKRTGAASIISSIPTGGIGGAAAMATSIYDFIETTQRVYNDYVQLQEMKTYADDLDFEISCNYGDWSRI
ncbi:MAG: DUF1036 domain-containing protein [Bacteriovorax sp.]|nr:DUF1036 domain-containing protein [Bacteriovorax sp.]